MENGFAEDGTQADGESVDGAQEQAAAAVSAAPVDEPVDAPAARPADGPRDPRPFIVLTALVDSNARAAAVTMSHGDAFERALGATKGMEIAGLDIVELPVQPRAFMALRDRAASGGGDLVAVYDLFPLAAHLDPATRKVAGQFLAAEILWALEEQGTLAGVPLNLRLDVPRSWGDRSPKAVHEKLLESGALDLSDKAIDDFKTIKGTWDA